MWHLLILLFSSVQLGLIRLKLLRMIWSHRSLKLKRLCIITLHIMDVRSDSISGWEKEKLNKRDKWCNLKNCVWFNRTNVSSVWFCRATDAFFTSLSEVRKTTRIRLKYLLLFSKIADEDDDETSCHKQPQKHIQMSAGLPETTQPELVPEETPANVQVSSKYPPVCLKLWSILTGSSSVSMWSPAGDELPRCFWSRVESLHEPEI